MDESARFAMNVLYLAGKKRQIGETERQAGVSTGYLSRVVNTNASISLNVAYRIAKSLGMNIHDLIEMNIKASEIKERIASLEEELKIIEEQEEKHERNSGSLVFGTGAPIDL